MGKNVVDLDRSNVVATKFLVELQYGLVVSLASDVLVFSMAFCHLPELARAVPVRRFVLGEPRENYSMSFRAEAGPAVNSGRPGRCR